MPVYFLTTYLLLLGTFAYSHEKRPVSFVMSIRPSVSLSACIRSAHIGGILVAFDIGGIYCNPSRKSEFFSNLTKLSGNLHADPSKIYTVPDMKSPYRHCRRLRVPQQRKRDRQLRFHCITFNINYTVGTACLVYRLSSYLTQNIQNNIASILFCFLQMTEEMHIKLLCPWHPSK